MSTDAYMRQIEADPKQIREALALLESAQMHLSAREMSAQESAECDPKMDSSSKADDCNL
jgi:hypothetical protein